jgi:hypothetical protein
MDKTEFTLFVGILASGDYFGGSKIRIKLKASKQEFEGTKELNNE